MNAPEMVPIVEVRKETPTIKTFRLHYRVSADPGQFCMIWLPGIGEKPFGYSNLLGDVEISVAEVGPFTSALCKLEVGDKVGVRGPYGKGFIVYKSKAYVVGGGIGMAPLKPLVQKLIEIGGEVVVLLGARTREEIVFKEWLEKQDVELKISTDDGSFGEKGRVTELLEKEVEEDRVERIYACGPEAMLVRIRDIALEYNIPAQILMERYMKCGYGLCGQCVLDPDGLLVCLDGPVFDAKELVGSELGKYRRDEAGCKCEVG